MYSTKLLIAITPYAWENLPAGKPLCELYDLHRVLTSRVVKGNSAVSVWRELMYARWEMEKSVLLVSSTSSDQVRSFALGVIESKLLPSLVALVPGEREKQICSPRQVSEAVQAKPVPVNLTDRVKRIVYSWLNLDGGSLAFHGGLDVTRVIPPPISWEEMRLGLESLNEWCIPPGTSYGGASCGEMKRLAIVASLIEVPRNSYDSSELLRSLKLRLSDFFELAALDGCGLIQMNMLHSNEHASGANRQIRFGSDREYC